MKILFSFLLIILSSSSFSQNNFWYNTKRWKLYKIQGNEAFKCPPDSLEFRENIPLNADSLRLFLKNASVWPKDKYSLWMGSWLVSFEDENDNLHKFDISMYGGFVFDENLKTYYEVPGELKKEWLQFINDNYVRFSSHEHKTHQ
ncbi:MAG TPA: hypothetical protein VMT76_01725 [Puia sp.]|nr:hypothetical protein [Puia sp.]